MRERRATAERRAFYRFGNVHLLIWAFQPPEFLFLLLNNLYRRSFIAGRPSLIPIVAGRPPIVAHRPTQTSLVARLPSVPSRRSYSHVLPSTTTTTTTTLPLQTRAFPTLLILRRLSVLSTMTSLSLVSLLPSVLCQQERRHPRPSGHSASSMTQLYNT